MAFVVLVYKISSCQSVLIKIVTPAIYSENTATAAKAALKIWKDGLREVACGAGVVKFDKRKVLKKNTDPAFEGLMKLSLPDSAMKFYPFLHF